MGASAPPALRKTIEREPHRHEPPNAPCVVLPDAKNRLERFENTFADTISAHRKEIAQRRNAAELGDFALLIVGSPVDGVAYHPRSLLANSVAVVSQQIDQRRHKPGRNDGGDLFMGPRRHVGEGPARLLDDIRLTNVRV